MTFSDMEIYEVALSFVEHVYEATKSFPEDEKFGLVSQMRRAAVSIPSNMAEGNGRGHSKEYLHFSYNARGSLMELRAQLDISKRLGYMSEVQHKELSDELDRVRKMLQKLIFSIKDKTR